MVYYSSIGKKFNKWIGKPITIVYPGTPHTTIRTYILLSYDLELGLLLLHNDQGDRCVPISSTVQIYFVESNNEETKKLESV